MSLSENKKKPKTQLKKYFLIKGVHLYKKLSMTKTVIINVGR